MVTSTVWSDFIKRLGREQFEIIERHDLTSEYVHHGVLAADPTRKLLLYATSFGTSEKSVVGRVFVSGFANMDKLTGTTPSKMFGQRCTTDNMHAPYIFFEYQFETVDAGFAWLRDPAHVATFSNWKPVSYAVVSGPGTGHAKSWREFCGRAPASVKRFTGQ